MNATEIVYVSLHAQYVSMRMIRTEACCTYVHNELLSSNFTAWPLCLNHVYSQAAVTLVLQPSCSCVIYVCSQIVLLLCDADAGK